MLKKAQQRGHILEGLIYAVCDIDEIVRLIRSSKTRDEAIEKLRSVGPDLVLLDIVMPEQDGLSTCRAIRARSRSTTSRSPIAPG